MRVLCLHSETSSAYQFSQELQKLEERLWTKHGIELVFVDGPLLDVQVGTAVGEEGGGINAIESSGINNDSGEERISRRWYVEEESRRALTNQSITNSTPPPQIQYSGLDASILHLSQIWTRGGANISNNLGECLPFQGVLGVGQGASVASLLPLLNYQNEDEEVLVDCEKENNNIGGLTQHTKPSMFQGLQFVVSIDGKDILSRRDINDVGSEEEEEENEEVYVGPDGVQSLHVINTESNTSQSSEQLAKQYGINATIHHYKQQQPSKATTSTTHITPTLSNIIGKYLVSQKNKLHSNPKTRELISLQNQLANVEQLATLAISQEIQKNPPKALMAVIGPTAMINDTNDDGDNNKDSTHDKEVGEEETQHNKQKKDSVKVVDKAVGAWHGARRRGFGEEGGGAPCPGEFLLREEERQGAVTSAAKSSSLVNPKDPNASLI